MFIEHRKLVVAERRETNGDTTADDEDDNHSGGLQLLLFLLLQQHTGCHMPHAMLLAGSRNSFASTHTHTQAYWQHCSEQQTHTYRKVRHTQQQRLQALLQIALKVQQQITSHQFNKANEKYTSVNWKNKPK